MQEMTASTWKRTGSSMIWHPTLLADLGIPDRAPKALEGLRVILGVRPQVAMQKIYVIWLSSVYADVRRGVPCVCVGVCQRHECQAVESLPGASGPTFR